MDLPDGSEFRMSRAGLPWYGSLTVPVPGVLGWQTFTGTAFDPVSLVAELTAAWRAWEAAQGAA
jgi:hypothetical protein